MLGGVRRVGSKKSKHIPVPPRDMGLKSCLILAPSPLWGGENLCGAKEGRVKRGEMGQNCHPYSIVSYYVVVWWAEIGHHKKREMAALACTIYWSLPIWFFNMHKFAHCWTKHCSLPQNYWGHSLLSLYLRNHNLPL